MNKVITKAEDSLSSKRPLEYSLGTLPGGGVTALMTCSNGHISSLTNHEIDIVGKVQPSVVCAYDDCEFHEYVTLEGWDDG